MENYQLKNDEVVLFRGNIKLLQGAKKSKGKVETELLLTNENFVFINKTKKLFQKEEVETLIVPIKNMKVYKDLPYLVRKGELIEIYTLDGEYFLTFENKKQAKEFFNKTMRVASGYSKFVRGIKKATKEIKETNDALGIDVVDSTKKAVGFVADVAMECVDKKPKGKLQIVGVMAKVLKKRNSDKVDKKTKSTMQLESSVESNDNLLPSDENDSE